MSNHQGVAIWTARQVLTPHPLQILVVDDYAIGAEAVALGLASTGHDARYATNGEGALQCMIGWVPDVAVLDINMPAPDGYRLAATLRALSFTRGLVIIAHTSMDEHLVRLKGLAAGFDAFCQKGKGAKHLIDLIVKISVHP